MISISKKVEYSVILLSFLSKNRDKVVSLSSACRILNLPYRFMGQLVADLKNGGMVESREGKKGGYVLVKNWQDKSLWQLLSALGEDKRIVSCLGHEGECDREEECKMKKVWQRVERVLKNELQSIKLKSL